MEVATQFFMLVLDTTRAIEKSNEKVRAILSRAWIYILKLLLLCLLEVWKEKWFEKMSMRQWPSINSLLKGSKDEKTLLNLLSTWTTGPLIFNHYLGVRLFNDSQWEMVLDDELVSSRNLKI